MTRMIFTLAHLFVMNSFPQIWMFVTQVHVKILGLVTTLEPGSLCVCALQCSEESRVKVRAKYKEVDLGHYWLDNACLPALYCREYNFRFFGYVCGTPYVHSNAILVFFDLF